MPRPTRLRQAASPVTNKPDKEDETRGRTRTTRSKGSRLSLEEANAIEAANKSRDAALDRLANEDVTTTADDTKSSIEFGRRTPARRDTTGIDLADSVFFDLDDSFENQDVPAGGRSTDTSTFQLSHIKPRSRSRASSFIGARNEAVIRPSSRGGQTPLVSSSFNIGAFRRRAREPSILGASRRPLDDTTAVTISQETHISDTDSEVDESFAPEAESTPINNQRKTRLAQENEDIELPNLASSSRKRKSDGFPSSARPGKVMRSEDSRPEVEVEEPQRELNVEESDADSESESELSSPPSHSLPMERPQTPINQSDYAAPPASSSSGAEEAWPSIHILAKRRRRRPSATDLSDLSSPPSLTHSPNYADRAPKTRGARQQEPVKLTTADLTNLLPKRRAKKTRDEFDLESEGELDTTGIGQDEDELSYLDATRRRKASGSKGRTAGTYTRRGSDKENENQESDEDEAEASRFDPLPDDTFEPESGSGEGASLSADELKAAARKFKEVDRWELEFEEATQPSSPPGAR